MGAPSARCTLVVLDRAPRDGSPGFAEEVRAGLAHRPKSLPCTYLYDEEGSRLFEQICALPEYYLSRAERQILADRAGDVVRCLPTGCTLVELGSGSAAKTRLLIDAFLRERRALRYLPVDISRATLEHSASALAAAYPGLEVTALAGDYLSALQRLRGERQHAKLIVWLGSSIGNFPRTSAAHLLARVCEIMTPADRLLVGIDLRKDHALLERAYSDRQGVTARFNRNLLVRINRELGGRFDPGRFRHRASYQAREGRVSMHLVSEDRQRVAIDRLGIEVDFHRHEAIHTESSYKYSHEESEALAGAAGLRVAARWLDRERLYSVNLLELAGG